MQMLQGVWKQHLRPHAVVGYGVKIFLPSPPNYVTRSPGSFEAKFSRSLYENFLIALPGLTLTETNKVPGPQKGKQTFRLLIHDRSDEFIAICLSDNNKCIDYGRD